MSLFCFKFVFIRSIVLAFVQLYRDWLKKIRVPHILTNGSEDVVLRTRYFPPFIIGYKRTFSNCFKSLRVSDDVTQSTAIYKSHP